MTTIPVAKSDSMLKIHAPDANLQHTGIT